MATPVSVLGMPGLNLVDSNTTSYGLGGQMSPEQALQEQALNRKRQIANLLIQRGLQQPQGQMAGRFYVPPSWAQGLNQAGGMVIGALLNKQFDAEQKALSDKSQQDVAAALANFRTQTGPQTQTLEQEGPGAPVAKSLMEVDPYIQQVNANAQPSKMWDQQTIIDQGKNGAGTVEVPAEMNAALEIQRERQQRGPGFYREGPRPTTDITAAASPEQRQQAIIDLLANQHPQVRALGAMLQQSDERKAEKQEQRDFMRTESELNRDVRREGIEQNALMRVEQMRQNMILTQMQIDARTQAGHDATDLKKTLAEQQATLQKQLHEMDIAGRKDLAKQQADLQKQLHSMDIQGRKDIAGMQVEGKKDALAQKEQAKQDKVDAGRDTVSSLVATLRDAYDQLDQAGGITNPEKGPLENLTASAGSSSVGQTIGGMFGTKNQSLRNQISQQRPLLLNAIKEATGMSAKQMDSNAELKMYLSAATDPTLDVKANRAALDKLEELYGLRGGSSAAPSAPAKASGPSIDDLLNKYK